MLSVALKRHSLTNQLAAGISHLFCPPCVGTGGMLLAAGAQPSPKGWLCAGTYVCLAVFLPLLMLFWLMGQGQVSDLDVTRREERYKPFLAAVGGAAAAWGGAPCHGRTISPGTVCRGAYYRHRDGVGGDVVLEN